MILSRTRSDDLKARARASLIDRLIDRHPFDSEELRPFRTVDRDALRASIQRDLSWLFNTRTPISGSLYDLAELTVTEYGIPDFGAYSPENRDDQKKLIRRLTRAVEAYEPRLTHVSVRVTPDMVDEKKLAVWVDGDMILESMLEPVSFLTILDRKTGIWNIHEPHQRNSP